MGSIAGKVTRSSRRETSRVTVSPITARPSSPTWKPSVEKGMRTSVNHPSAVIVERAAQKASQLPLVVAPSSDTSTSKRIPAGVVPNHLALRLSSKTSR